MIKKFKTLSAKQNTTKNNTHYTIQGNRKRFTTNKYCWKHGACAHTSTKCEPPRVGHKSDATFQGGSTDFCLPTK